MMRASQIRKSVLETSGKIEDIFETHKQRAESIKENEEHGHSHGIVADATSSQTSPLTPYLLLIALSFHGLFEGIALGLQKNAKATLSLLLAILAHKWAEALTLGLSFAKTDTEKSTFLKMVTIFSIFTPIGIGIGMALQTFPEWVTACFMSMSVGTFIYIGAAEIVVEEFSLSRYKWQKFCFYLIGGAFIFGLTVWEIAGEGEEEDEHDERRVLTVMHLMKNYVSGLISN